MAAIDTNRVWLITGCSSGMGHDLAEAVLERGYRVVVTARQQKTLQHFTERYSRRALALTLDVTDHGQIDSVVSQAVEHFGSIDVLVNNAGYGYLAAIEEGEEIEVRAMFETNFFGLMAMTKAVLPHMRERRSGCIINNSSQAGLMSNPGTGYYSTTKYAVEAFTESLRQEVAPLGIKVCAVEPGPFRTEWSGRSMKRTRTPIDDYAENVHARCDMIQQMDGLQPGDPEKAAHIIVRLAEMDDPPQMLLLGRIVLDAYRAKLARISSLLDEWEEVTVDAEYDD